MEPADKFQVGDRVRVIKPIKGWEGFGPEATIVQPFMAGHIGAGASKKSRGSWPIHLDHYNYGPSGLGNYHTVASEAIEYPAPTDEEINEVFFGKRL